MSSRARVVSLREGLRVPENVRTSKISRHESQAAALSCTCTRDGVLQLASGKYHVRAVLLQPRQLQAEALLNTFLLHNRVVTR